MGRFDRESSSADALGIATEVFGSTVERKLNSIVDAARQRAATIEREAAERAARIDREAGSRARRGMAEYTDWIERVLASIDRLDSVIGDQLRALKEDLSELVGDADERSKPTASADREPIESGKAKVDAPTPLAEAKVDAPTPLAEAKLAAPAPLSEPRHDAPTTLPEPLPLSLLRARGGEGVAHKETVRAHLEKMFSDGRPRADAERFLIHLDPGAHHLGVLEEVYGASNTAYSPARRRGITARMRRRQR